MRLNDVIVFIISMYDIVNDAPKKLILEYGFTRARGKNLKNFHVFWKTKVFFTTAVCANVCRCGSRPTRIYGKPKMHKLKSITCIIYTSNYRLAKFFTNLLNPVITAQYCSTDSFSFCKEIQELSGYKKFMLSYNVYSLFLNILLKQTIELPVNLPTLFWVNLFLRLLKKKRMVK